MASLPTEAEARAILYALYSDLTSEWGRDWSGDPRSPKPTRHSNNPAPPMPTKKIRPIDDWIIRNGPFNPRRTWWIDDGAHRYFRDYLDMMLGSLSNIDTDRNEFSAKTVDEFERALMRITDSLLGLNFYYSHAIPEIDPKSYDASIIILQRVAGQSEGSLLPEIHGSEAVERHNHRWEEYHDAMQQLLGEKNQLALQLLHNLAQSGREKIRTQSGVGRTRAFWRDDFVSQLAHLWWNMFSKLPGVQSESPFTRMISAVWETALECYPPPQDALFADRQVLISPERIEAFYGLNWDHTVRDVVGKMKLESQYSSNR